MDGATRMQIIWHITIPSILPTYFVIVMLNIASFLSNGMEQYYVFQNAFNQDYIEVLDLGLIDKPISFLKSKEHLWFKMWLWLTWKNAGWAAIMYLAAITGIDEQMIEAAKVDGATRMQIIWNITIPSILPTYFVIVMLNIASFLSNGMEQYYVFQNAFNQEYIEVLDLYVYNIATSSTGNYPLSTAISMLKSVVSIILLTGANTASKMIRGEGFI